MKKILAVLLCLTFTAGISYSQEAFLSLTKYSEPVEKLPTNITVITSDDIEKKHAETLGELLQNETSVNYKTYGTPGAASTISIRGASALQTLVMIDGRRVNDIGLGSADFTSIPVANIERVEIIRGAGSSIYGTSAFGGVVNVITKKATLDSPVLDADISYGSFNTLQGGMVGAYANDKTGALVGSSMISSDGDRVNSAFNSQNLLFNASVKTTANSDISLSANIYESVSGVPGSLSFPSDNAEQKDSNKYLKADYSALFGENSLKVSAYTSQNKRKYSESSAFGDTKDHYTGDVIGAQADFVYDKILLAGGEWWQEMYKKEDLITDSTLTDKSRIDTALYAQLRLELWKFNIIPSLRGDSNSAYGEILTPAVSLVFNAAEGLKFSANSGKVWRAPTFSELYDNYPAWSMFGNPGLDPEHGISNDIGAEYSFGKFRFAATGFYITTDDLIKFNGTTYENIDKTRQYGAELEAGQIITSWLSHKINYTYLKAENSDTDETLAYSPENTANYTLTVKPVSGLTVSALLFYKDSQKTGTAAHPELDGFITLGLNADYKINENLSCWIKGSNLTNEDYQMVYDYPMPGTTVYGGVSLKFWK